MILPVTAAVVVLALVLITVTGFIVYKRNKGEREKCEDFKALILVVEVVKLKQASVGLVVLSEGHIGPG